MFKEPSPDFPIDQADILEGVFFPGPQKTLLGIVVTPVCDIAQDKADYITSCAVFRAHDTLDVFLQETWESKLRIERGEPLSKTKLNDLLDKIQPIFRGQFHRYHWLDPFPNQQEPCVVDFQIIASTPFESTKAHTRLFGLKSPWREAIPARFAAYAGRVGVPPPDPGDLRRQIQGWLETRFPGSGS